MEPLEGIAAADARLGRTFPLPACPLPLTRWVEVEADADGVQVAWNFDDSRPGSPGRLVLLASTHATTTQLSGAPIEAFDGCELRRDTLDAAQPSLRPVVELRWQAGDLALRLTAQGPWADENLREIVASVVV